MYVMDFGYIPYTAAKKEQKQMVCLKVLKIIGFWSIALIIAFPLVLSFCKSGQQADRLNALVNNDRKEKCN